MVLRMWTQLCHLSESPFPCCIISTPLVIDLLKWTPLDSYGRDKDRIKETSEKAVVTVPSRVTGRAALIKVVRRGQSQDVFVDGVWWGKRGVKDDLQVISMSNWLNCTVIYRDGQPVRRNSVCVCVSLFRQAVWLCNEWHGVNFICKDTPWDGK